MPKGDKSIPAQAAEWIACLHPHQLAAESLKMRGCAAMTVPLIKRTYHILRQMQSESDSININLTDVSSYAKKSIHVEALNKSFYMDASCCHENIPLMNELKRKCETLKTVTNEARISAEYTSVSTVQANEGQPTNPLNSNNRHMDSLAFVSSPTTQQQYQQVQHQLQPSGNIPPDINTLRTPPFAYINQKNHTHTHQHLQLQQHHSSVSFPQHTARPTPTNLAFSSDPAFPTAHMPRKISPRHRRSPNYKKRKMSSPNSQTPNRHTHSQPLPHHYYGPSGQTNNAAANTPTRNDYAFGNGSMHTATQAATAASNDTPSTTSENAADQNETPTTPLEIQIFKELGQMGFVDAREILTGIRHFTQPSPVDQHNNQDPPHPIPENANINVTSDQVMVWIITQREEMEEARKMDLARLQSEQLRDENAAKQAQAEKDKEGTLSNLDGYCELFPQSWVLKSSGFRGRISDIMRDKNSTAKETEILTRFLKYEQKSKKWYEDLPSCYFQRIAERLFTTLDVEKLLENMEAECTLLNDALYKLSEQQGGVPKVFLIANEEDTHKRGDHNEDTDDDEIEILDCKPAALSSPNTKEPNIIQQPTVV